MKANIFVDVFHWNGKTLHEAKLFARSLRCISYEYDKEKDILNITTEYDEITIQRGDYIIRYNNNMLDVVDEDFIGGCVEDDIFR